MSSVIQPWVFDLPWKMQSVLMTSTRGPDEVRLVHVKMANRWIRSVLFHDADPANPFIVKPGDKPPVAMVGDLQTELEYLRVHYFTHLIHAFEIIGYMHPDDEVAAMADCVYVKLCFEVLHLPPESKETFEARLSDVTIHA